MSASLADLYISLESNEKPVRLKALKLILRHPEAKPIDLVRCLCSEHIRNFVFLEEFELSGVMRSARARLRGVGDADVYEHLASLYRSDPENSFSVVVLMLESLRTRRALEMLEAIRASPPPRPDHARSLINDAYRRVSDELRSPRKVRNSSGQGGI